MTAQHHGGVPGAADRFRDQKALLLEHRRLVLRANSLLAGASTRLERLALADDLMTLIDRLDAARAALGDTIRRGRAARTAATAYGRATGCVRSAPRR